MVSIFNNFQHPLHAEKINFTRKINLIEKHTRNEK